MRTSVAVVLMFAGCTFFSETQNPDTLPELVFRTSLPEVPSDWAYSQPKMEVLFEISRTGEVLGARFVNATGYELWEAKALEEMKRWRFSPAHLGQDSVSVWVRLPIAVRFTDQKVIFLAQLICTDRACADSAHQLLILGHPFENIVEKLPGSGLGTYEKYIGETDISAYPRELQNEIKQLKESGYTRPIRIGDSYVIFKRLANKHISGV